MLEDYAEKNGFTGIRHFTDDGISDTSFEREGLQTMLAEVEKGNIGTIIVKYFPISKIKAESRDTVFAV